MASDERLLAERSYATIDTKDLERLAVLAKDDRERFFSRHPRWQRLYSNRIVCVALCQGAALHYIDGKNGIKDFDVWTFYAKHPRARFPRRPVVSRDFGPSKFGWSPLESNLAGRRVDLIGRSIPCDVGADPLETIQRYLVQARTVSAQKLAEKAVVIIEPANRLGTVAWSKGKPRMN